MKKHLPQEAKASLFHFSLTRLRSRHEFSPSKKIKIIRAKSRRTQFAFASDIRGKRRVLFTKYHVFKTVLFLCPHNLVPTQCLYSYTLCTICTLRIAIHSSAITKHFLLFYFAIHKNIYTPDVHTNHLYRMLFQCMLESTTKC